MNLIINLNESRKTGEIIFGMKKSSLVKLELSTSGTT